MQQNAVWITIFLMWVSAVTQRSRSSVVCLINLGGAKFYGEAEFWFASIKVITIVGLISPWDARARD